METFWETDFPAELGGRGQKMVFVYANPELVEGWKSQ